MKDEWGVENKEEWEIKWKNNLVLYLSGLIL